MQPRPGESPITFGRTDRDLQCGGGLLTQFGGLVGDLLTDYGLPPELADSFPALGAATTEVSAMTIGASNVHAFVGLDGPYWEGDADGDGNLDNEGASEDLDGDGVFGEDEVNENAKGLLIDDFDFGMAILKPTNPFDFSKYTSLHASANKVGLVGIDNVTAEATEILVEVNLSSPSFYGVPLFPVVDYLTTTQLGDEQRTLLDTNSNGEVTVGELRALAGQASGTAGTGPF